MKQLYLSLIASFIAKYREEAYAISTIISNTVRKKAKERLDEEAKKRLEPIVQDLFKEGIIASNQIMKSEIVRLTNILEVPFKYNKDLLKTINGDSIFTGFFDKNFQDLYTKREIDALKRKILAGKYQGSSDRDIASSLQNTVNMTKQRALLTARLETQRLESAAVQAFYDKKEVKSAYQKVWHQNTEYDRHKYMDGQIADEDGFFDCKGVKVTGAPEPNTPWNCLCTVTLEKIK